MVGMDVTVIGSLVDANGNPVSGLSGAPYALYPDGERWPQFGQVVAIKNSAFTIKLSSSISAEYPGSRSRCPMGPGIRPSLGRP